MSYQKLDSGTGAGQFANSVLYFMSRDGAALFGEGDLDEVAIYNRALSAGTIADHYCELGHEPPPDRRLHDLAEPGQARPDGDLQRLGASTDPDGTIAKLRVGSRRQRQLRADTGPAATSSRSYATATSPTVKPAGHRRPQRHRHRDADLTVANTAPTAAFTATPNPAQVGATVAFNGSGIVRPRRHDRQVRVGPRRQRQLRDRHRHHQDDVADATARPGRDRELRVTDNDGLTATTTRTVTVVAANQAPRRPSRSPPAPATGQTVTFNGSASSDPDGTIVKYEWDLDGNGSFETDTGTTTTTSRSYAAAGSVSVKLRVTDNDGLTAQATKTAFINATPAGSGYAAAVLATSGLSHYWRMGELTGRTLADSAGASPATTAGGAEPRRTGRDRGRHATRPPASTAPTTPRRGTRPVRHQTRSRSSSGSSGTVRRRRRPRLRVHAQLQRQRRRLPGRSERAAGRRALRGRPSAAGLSSQQRLLHAAERRPVAPLRARARRGGAGAPVRSRRTSTGGRLVHKGASGTGAGNFANSQLYFMSARRLGACSARAIWTRSRSTAARSRRRRSPPPRSRRQRASDGSFTASPNPVATGQTVSFDGTASSDPDGTSRSTSGTSTATAATRPTPAPPATATQGLRADRRGDRRPAGDRQRRPPRSTTRSLTVRTGAGGVLHRNARHGADRPGCRVQRGRLHRRRRHDRQVRVGPRRQRQLRDRHRHDQRRQPGPTRPPGPERRAAGDRQRRQHRRGDPRCDYHQPPAQRFVHGHAHRGPDPPDRELQRRRLERSGRHAWLNTRGISTATAATRRSPVPPRPRRGSTPRPAPSPSGCG